MKKLIATIAIAALPATAALASFEHTFTRKFTVDDLELESEWRYELTDKGVTPGTATLLWAKKLSGDGVKIPNELAILEEEPRKDPYTGQPMTDPDTGEPLTVTNTYFWTVTKIADGALANQPGLLKVEVPNSILEIGAYAFSNCTALSEVTINYGTRYIGERAFVNTAVQAINVPDSLIDMGGNISAGTLFTSSINIGDSSHFAYSEDGVLYNRDMTKLYACPARAEGTIDIPDTVTNICADAFFGCHRLSSLELPESLSVIGSGAFNVKGIWPGLSAPESTPKLMTVIYKGSVPAAADNIYEGAPAGLVSLVNEDAGFPSETWKGRRVEINTGSSGEEPPPTPTGDSGTDGTWVWTVDDGFATLYNGGASALVNTKTSGAISVPSEVTDSGSGNNYPVVGIGDHALYGCSLVTSIALPDTIKSIGKEPFAGTLISELTIPAYVATIDGNPAVGCEQFRTFMVSPNNIKFSGDDYGLLYDYNGETLLAVPARASEITVPASVKAIAADAFASCSVLTKVTYLGNAPTAEANLYAGTPDTLTSYVSESATGFTEDIWKGRPIVVVSSGSGGGDEPPPPGETCETIGGLTWYYRVVDGVAEIYRDGKTAVASDSTISAITFPTTLGGYQVKGLGDGALAGLRGISSVSVPGTYEWIGAYAFSNCTSLASVTIPFGIRYIGERPFVNTIVSEISLPDSLLDMGGNVSAGTLFTSTISIGDSSHFKYSDDGVLYNRDMTKLYACPTRAEGTVTIPNTVNEIATDAFFGCHRLSYLNLPATVGTIGDGAFNVYGIWPGLAASESTPKLLSVFYNGPVPTAADDIYAGAPDGLVSYALDADWDGLSTWKDRAVVIIDETNPPVLSFTDATGITWYYRISNDEVEIYNEDASGNPTTAVSPASTSGIPYKESEESTVTRKALKVPDAINGYAVTKIGAHAFDGCKALIYVGIPSTVREIGDGAFRGCASISAIGDSQAIPFGTADDTIALPRGVTKLGYRPFEGTQASTVTLPYTLSETAGNPVAGCEFVSTVSIDASCPHFSVSNGAMYDKARETLVALPANGSGKTFEIPSSVTRIGAEAFAGCRFLKELAIPADVAEIEANAFDGCSSLVSVTYAGDAPTAADDIYSGTPEDLTSYASGSAAGFTSDTWKSRPIVLSADDEEPAPSGLSETIGGVTWYYRVVDGMAEIYRDGGTAVTSESPISSLTLPATLGGRQVKGIGDGALSDLRGITSVSVPSTYEWIGDEAFSNCTSLASVTLSYGLRTIGRHPFDGTAISTLAIPDTVSAIDGNVLWGCNPSVAISVGGNNPYFSVSAEGALYDKDFENLLVVPMTAETLAVHETTTNIAEEAFANCIRMKKLVFAGDAPTAADDVFADTPETMTSYVSSDAEGFTEGTWKDRPIKATEAGEDPEAVDSNTDGTWVWTVENGVALLYNGGASAFVNTNFSGAVSVPAEVTDSGSGNKYTVAALGDRALAGCSFVTAVTLPSTIKSIGKEPFAGTLISTLAIPAYVEDIDGNPAAGCERFTGFTVDSANIDFASDDAGLLYYGDDWKLLVAVPARATTVDVPAAVIVVADDAFAGCSVLTRVNYAGDAPTAVDGIYADTPATMTSYVSADSEGFTDGTWKGRPIVIPSPDDPEDPTTPDATNQVYDDGTVKWTYDIVGGKAVITGAEGDVEGKVVTIPAELDGFATSKMKSDALDGLTGVRAYASSSPTFTAKNGCLYSANGKTLVRVPDGITLPYTVTTTVSSNIVTVTTIPGLKDSGNMGNDGTSVTTNTQSVVKSQSTTSVAGDISFETLLDGVTVIADHAFYGCNASLEDVQEEVSETISGETGFIGAKGDPYIRVVTAESSVSKTYTTAIALPASVKSVSETAFDGSTVEVAAGGAVPSVDYSSPDIATTDIPTDSKAALEEKTSYIGWIEKNGKIVGTVTVKTGRVKKGALAINGQLVRIGKKKLRAKSLADLEKYGEVKLFKNPVKSGSAAEKATLGKFNGKGWTLAFNTTADSPLLGGYTVLSVAAANGKARITGFAADGTKISSTAQMLVDGNVCRIPAAIQMFSGKKGGFPILLSIRGDGTVSVEQLGDFTAVVGGKKANAEISLVAASKRSGKLTGSLFVGDGVAEAGYRLGNLKEWKPRMRNGIFKGYVYFYKSANGKRIKAKVNGALVGGTGYGSVVLKNSGSWKVEVVPNAK